MMHGQKKLWYIYIRHVQQYTIFISNIKRTPSKSHEPNILSTTPTQKLSYFLVFSINFKSRFVYWILFY